MDNTLEYYQSLTIAEQHAIWINGLVEVGWTVSDAICEVMGARQ